MRDHCIVRCQQKIVVQSRRSSHTKSAREGRRTGGLKGERIVASLKLYFSVPSDARARNQGDVAARAGRQQPATSRNYSSCTTTNNHITTRAAISRGRTGCQRKIATITSVPGANRHDDRTARAALRCARGHRVRPRVSGSRPPRLQHNVAAHTAVASVRGLDQHRTRRSRLALAAAQRHRTAERFSPDTTRNRHKTAGRFSPDTRSDRNIAAGTRRASSTSTRGHHHLATF